jgi:hypothetical protein
MRVSEFRGGTLYVLYIVMDIELTLEIETDRDGGMHCAWI